MVKSFLETLFGERESTCFAENPRGTKVYPLGRVDVVKHAFFSINALDPVRDREPMAEYHSESRPRRADHNVASYRNILIEMDKGALRDQWALVSDLGLPFTSAVYSGGKSYHFIVSLSEPCRDRPEYDALVRRVYRVFGDRIDGACKNPSRLSRLPGHYREDCARFQTLTELRQRVLRVDLEEWLVGMGVLPDAGETMRAKVSHREPGELHPLTKKFLKDGAAEGEWNNALFRSACDAFGNHWGFEEFVECAERITGHLDHRDLMTIRSAWQRGVRRVS